MSDALVWLSMAAGVFFLAIGVWSLWLRAHASAPERMPPIGGHGGYRDPAGKADPLPNEWTITVHPGKPIGQYGFTREPDLIQADHPTMPTLWSDNEGGNWRDPNGYPANPSVYGDAVDGATAAYKAFVMRKRIAEAKGR